MGKKNYPYWKVDQVRRQFIRGDTVASIAEKHDISSATINKWAKQHNWSAKHELLEQKREELAVAQELEFIEAQKEALDDLMLNLMNDYKDSKDSSKDNIAKVFLQAQKQRFEIEGGTLGKDKKEEKEINLNVKFEKYFND